MEGNESASSAVENTGSESVNEASNGVTNEGSGNAAPKSVQQADEEMIEIALGSVKGKVSKQMAEAMKGFEKAARSKIQEASEIRKERDTLKERIKSDPKGVMRDHGIDPHEWAEMTLAEKLEELQKSPEERERDELKKYKEQTEAEKRAAKEREEQTLEEKRREDFARSTETEIIDAFQASGLPKDPMLFRMMAGEMRAAALREENLTAKEAAFKIKQDLKKAFQGLLSHGDKEAAIKEYLDENFLKDIREFELKRVTGKSASALPSGYNKGTGSNSHPDTPKKPDRKPMTEREFIKRFGA